MDQDHLAAHDRHQESVGTDQGHLPIYDRHQESVGRGQGRLPIYDRHQESVETDQDHLPKLQEPKELEPRMSRRLPTRYSGAPWLPSTQVTPMRLPIDTYTYTLRTEN